MKLIAATLALLSATSHVLAHEHSEELPSCITTCINDNLISSQCDGDEEGDAADTCLCNSLNGSLMVECMKEDCSEDDQAQYVGHYVPESCQETLFPGITPADHSEEDDSDEDEATPTGEGSTEPSDDAAVGLTGPGVIAAGGLLAALLL